MNTKHALGFLAAGVVMKSIPLLAPFWFPPTGPGGANASAIWLACMGLVEVVIGGGYLIRHQVIPTLMRLAQSAAAPRRTRVAAAWRTARGATGL